MRSLRVYVLIPALVLIGCSRFIPPPEPTATPPVEHTNTPSPPPALDALVVHYALENNARDQSTAHHDGDLSGRMGFDAGVCNQAVWFEDKPETRIKIPYHRGLDVTDAFTISLWVHPTHYRSETTDSHMLFAQWLTSPEMGDYILRLGAGEHAGLLSLTVANHAGGEFNADYIMAPDAQRVPLDEWTHVASTFDQGVVHLYINGQEVTRQTSTVKYTETRRYTYNDLVIGNTWTNQFYPYGFIGGMDEVYLFNKALTDEEIEALASICAG